jgi:hypothetical protein
LLLGRVALLGWVALLLGRITLGRVTLGLLRRVSLLLLWLKGRLLAVGLLYIGLLGVHWQLLRGVRARGSGGHDGRRLVDCLRLSDSDRLDQQIQNTRERERERENSRMQ